VCNPGEDLGLDILEGVASLANKSLLRQAEGTEEPRFFMLETIREFAAERLSEDPDSDEVWGRHAAYFLNLAERAAPEVTGADQVHWLDLLSAEHGNLRAALSRATEEAQAETALGLAASLWRFWQMRWNLRDGLERIQGVLEMPGAEEHPEARAGALEAAGGLAYWIGDPRAEEYYEECLRLRRELGDRAAIAEALYNLSFTEIFRRDVDNRRYARAQELLEESLVIFRELDDQRGLAKVLWGLGDLFYEGGQLAKAEEYNRRALEMHRAQGDRFGVSWDLFLLGLTVHKLERHQEARRYHEEALELLADARDTSGIPLVLGGLASVAAAEGDGERAVRLAAAAAGLELTYGGGLTSINEQVEEWERQRRELIPQGEEYDRLWAEGQAMGVDQAVAYALGRQPAGGSSTP
jgi:tetratricopeptide (TPR) repeat protein